MIDNKGFSLRDILGYTAQEMVHRFYLLNDDGPIGSAYRSHPEKITPPPSANHD
jgi:hypothetical protein